MRDIFRQWRFVSVSVLFLTIICTGVTWGRNQKRSSARIEESGRLKLEALEHAGKISAQTTVAVLIAFRMHADPLYARAGFRPTFCWDKFCSGEIEYSLLLKLAAQEEIVMVKVTGVISRNVERAIEKPVLIAVIDRGMLWRDSGFWDQGGRILLYWDQTDRHGPGPRTFTASYGTEFTRFELEKVRRSQPGLPSDYGHGVGIAHLAAANSVDAASKQEGSLSSLEVNSPIILVNTTGSEYAVLDAINYVVQCARVLGMKAVINLSSAESLGPHDRDDLFTSAVDAALGNDALLVISVGNEGGKGKYARLQPTEAGIFVSVDCPRKQGGEPAEYSFDLEAWYPRKPELQISMESPTGEKSPWWRAGNLSGWKSFSGRFLTDTQLVSFDSKKSGALIHVEGSCGGSETCGWKLKLQSNSYRSGTVDAWIRSGGSCTAHFLGQSESEDSISSLAAGRNVLSVGAYEVDRKSASMAPATYSSSGRTGDGIRKPDAFGPGTVDYFVDNLNTHLDMQGTSASAAIVTRSIASVWQKRADLPAERIHELFQGKIIISEDNVLFWKGSSLYTPATLDNLQKQLVSER
jgi:hypothetical protein